MRVVRALALINGAILGVAGVWAFVAPRSFYDAVATFPPYNEHFLHDLGAFQIGLAAVLLLALVWSDALLVVLAGVGTGVAAHAVGHFRDLDLGGSPADPWLVSLQALSLIAAAGLRWRALRR